MNVEPYVNVRLWLAKMNHEGFPDGKANQVGDNVIVWCPSEACAPCKGAKVFFPVRVHAVAALVKCDRCQTTFTSVVPRGQPVGLERGVIVRSYLGDLEINRN